MRILLLTIICGWLTLTVDAQNYTPNTFSDPAITSLNNSTGEINGGSTISLRSALMAADNLGGTHTVTLGSGTYLLDGSGTYTVPSQGTFVSRTIFMGNTSQDITINGNGPANTIINMDATGRDRILAVNYDGTTADVFTTINGVKFSNGYLNYDTYGGAAIYAGPFGVAETLTISNCAFDNNTCPGFFGGGGSGGAIYMFQGTLNIDNSSFANNQSVDGDGGAIIYLLFNLGDNGVINITNSTFTGNHAGSNGGAISFNSQGGVAPGQTFSATIDQNTFLNNSSTGFGGAISANNGAATSVSLINYNRFVGNTSTASASTSGLLYVNSDGDVNAENNWWGCNTGPTAAGTCNKASGIGSGGGGSLIDGKWLQLKLSASPSTICSSTGGSIGNSSTVTASFLSNSANEAIVASNLSALIGLPVNWGPSTLGSLSGQQTTIQASGTATALFTSNGTGGTATVNAQVDNVPAGESSPSRASITVNSSSTAPTGATGNTSICNGSSTTLTVSGGTKGTGAVTEWFTGSCGGTLIFTGDAVNVSPSSTSTYYVRYNGSCNTTSCASVTVTVNTSSTAPTGATGTTTICEGNSTTLTVDGGSKGTGAVTQWFTGSCGGTLIFTGDAVTVSPSSTTTYYVRYSGTCNNTSCASVTVTVNPLPVISAPTVVQPTCSTPTGTITVNATGTGTLEYALNAGTFQTSNVFSGLAPGNYNIFVRSQSAPDCVAAYSGNPVTLNAATGCCVPPTITCPGDQTANNSSGFCSATVTYSSSTTGTSPAVTYTFTGATTGSGSGNGSGSTFNVGVTTVSLTATNACGVATCSFTVTVSDVQPPSITCPANITVQCASAVPAPNTASVTASDNCGTVTVAWVSDVVTPGDCPNHYTIARTYSATDASENTSTCTQTITVNDNTAPTIICPAAVTVQCAGNVPPHDFAGGSASDNCGSVNVTWVSDNITAGDCPNHYSIARTYRATDACGNSSTCTQTITVNDNTAPTITCPAAITVQCAGNVPPHDFAGGSASDNCGAVNVAWVSDVVTAGDCPNHYSIARTYRATDACGNTSTCTQTITVNDNTAPTISCPAPVTVQCASAVPPHNFAGGTASDNCGAVTVTWTSDVISNQTCPNKYTLTRTYTATDACGNASSCTQIITVNDNVNPTISCPPSQTVAPTTLAGAVVTYATPVGMDNCSGATTTLTAGLASGSTFPIGTTTVTYTVTDACGNTASCSFTVTVSDPYCSADHKKVYVCHNGHTICINVDDLQSHLNHGDYLGPCQSTTRQTFVTEENPALEQKVVTTIQQSSQVKTEAPLTSAFRATAYPNPSQSDFAIRIQGGSNEPVVVRIMDMNGVLKSAFSQVAKSNTIRVGGELKTGSYIVEIRQGGNRQVMKLVKLH